MPRKNTRKSKFAVRFFHVYNRHVRGEAMFMDDIDRDVFIDCLQRHLSKSPSFDAYGRPYPNYRGRVRLITFALMPNHFHLILFQLRPGGIADLMHSALNGYVQRFNRRHGFTGPLFLGEYRARELRGKREILDGVLYVHNNHNPGCDCRYCGQRWFWSEGADSPGWADVQRALRLFGGSDRYLTYSRTRAKLREISG